MAGALVQGKGNSSSSATASITVNATNGLAPITAGNLLIAIVAYGHSSSLTASFKDQSNNPLSFTQVGTTQFDGGSDNNLAVYILPNCPAGITGITDTLSIAPSFGHGLTIEEWSGLATASQPDGTNQKQGTATTAANNVSSNAATNTKQPAIVWGVAVDCSHDSAPTQGTGYTAGTLIVDYGSGANYGRTEYQRVLATGAQTATWTNTGTSGDTFQALVMNLDEPSAPGGVPPSQFFLGAMLPLAPLGWIIRRRQRLQAQDKSQSPRA